MFDDVHADGPGTWTSSLGSWAVRFAATRPSSQTWLKFWRAELGVGVECRKPHGRKPAEEDEAMKRVMFLFAAVSLTSILGCASNPPPPAQTPEAAATQEPSKEAAGAQPEQPAPPAQPAPSSSAPGAVGPKAVTRS